MAAAPAQTWCENRTASFYDTASTEPRASKGIPDGGYFSIYSETDIKASPKQVYDTILDIGEWKTWNTFVKDVSVIKHPDPSAATVRMVPDTVMLFKVQMGPNEVVPTRIVCRYRDELKPSSATMGSSAESKITRISWSFDGSGMMVPSFLLRTERTHEIEELPDGTTRYRNWECFAGWVAGLVKYSTEEKLKKGFATWSQDLKKRAEGAQ